MLGISEKNRKDVLASPIIAKAVVRRENGRINIIVVFQQSTRHEFYWVFQARSAGSAQKSWKFIGMFGRDFNSDHKAYFDFQSFVAYFAGRNQAQVRTVRVRHNRRMAALLTKTAHESIHADWTPQDLSKGKASFTYVNKLASIGRGERRSYFNNRNRDLDESLQSTNEVLVYEDYCEECMSRHSYAHFVDATRNKCKLDYSAMKSNPGFEYRGFKPSTGFRFTYRSVIGAGA